MLSFGQLNPLSPNCVDQYQLRQTIFHAPPPPKHNSLFSVTCSQISRGCTKYAGAAALQDRPPPPPPAKWLNRTMGFVDAGGAGDFVLGIR